jgi:hypothetical protein
MLASCTNDAPYSCIHASGDKIVLLEAFHLIRKHHFWGWGQSSLILVFESLVIRAGVSTINVFTIKWEEYEGYPKTFCNIFYTISRKCLQIVSVVNFGCRTCYWNATMCARWVPRSITNCDKTVQKEVCSDLLSHYEADGEAFRHGSSLGMKHGSITLTHRQKGMASSKFCLEKEV